MAVKGNKKQNIAIARPKWFLPLSIFIICITSASLYHKSVNNAYLDFDDMTFFVRDYSFIKDISNAPKAFTQGVFQGASTKDTGVSYYRPMLVLSFMLDAQISPASGSYSSPKPFIKANIVYHIIACVLLLLLLLEFNISGLAALLFTLIFTVHPLLNQAVAWIPGRNDPLLAIFILLSFFALVKYHKTKKREQFFLHILFFVLALFTKENALMFVPVVFIFLRIVYKEPFKTGVYTRLGIAYLICIIPWALLRQYSLASDRSIGTASDAVHNFLANTPYFIQYAGKIILPFDLSVMSTPADTNYFIGILAIAIIGAGIYYSKTKNTKLVIFGLAWFLLFIGLTFASSFTGLEHRAYLPLMGVLITASQFDIIKKRDAKNADTKQITGFIILFAVFVLYYALSASRLYIFENRFSFDKSAMIASPKSTTPCLYIAKEYELAGDYKNAISAYREALRRDSTLYMTHNDIAGEYLQMNKYPEAEQELRIELAKHPQNYVAMYNLGGTVFMKDRNYTECIDLFKKAIATDSAFTKPYISLSQVYQTRGDSANTILYRNLFFKKEAEKKPR